MNLFYVLIAFVILAVFAWTFYQIPVLAVGIKRLRGSYRKRREVTSADLEKLPTVSILVPVKDEERVVGRLLESLLKLNYPKEKMEILIVEDGSTDKTVEICERYVMHHPERVKLLHKPVSNGKPSALNCALKYARGEIVAVFDADNIPDCDVLKRAVKYFMDPFVAAVQGRLCCINADENMLTKFVSYEEAVWCEAYLRGKDALGLFIPLKGTCQFIRRDVLAKFNGFNEEALSEDMELSAKLTEEGYTIKYASDVRSLEEIPSRIKWLFAQRTRWYRGTMQVAFKYGRLMFKPNRKSLDTELTLLGPFILIASLISYFLAFYMSFTASNLDPLLHFLTQFSAVATSMMLAICGIALAYISKPRKVSNLLWLPFIYFYWSLQAFIALYALMLMLLRRPQAWVKTEKKGTVTGVFAG